MGSGSDPLYGLKIEQDDFLFKKLDFMWYESWCYPLLKLEMVYDAELKPENRFRFFEDESFVKQQFHEHINNLIKSFENFKNPEYVDIEI